MVFLILLAVAAACLAGYWWLGKTATPGQRAIEERWKANRGALRRATASVPGLMGRMHAGRAHRDADWWSRQPASLPEVPEPEEHKEPWRH